MNWAQCSIRTPYGLLASEWKLANEQLTLVVVVPANTTAEVVIPAASAEAVRAGTVAAVSAPGIKVASFTDGKVTLIVGSGRYEFTSSRSR